MPSVIDLNRFHSDADNYVRRLDGIIDQHGSRGGKRGDPAKLKSELQALAKDIQGQVTTNRDNYQYAELNDILGPLIAKSETKQGSVFAAINKYAKWKNERSRKLEEQVQEQEDAERAEQVGLDQREKQAREAKTKQALEKAKPTPKTIVDKTVGVKATEEEETTETETEAPKEVEEEEGIAPEAAETKERIARESAATPRPTTVSSPNIAVPASPVATAVTAGASVAAAGASRAMKAGGSTTAAPTPQTSSAGKAERRASTAGEIVVQSATKEEASEKGEVSVIAEAQAEKAASQQTAGSVEVTATVKAQGAAQPVGGQISVAAQSKVERAATGRGIPAGAEAMIFATPAQAAAIYASIATPIQNQVSQLDGYIKGTNRNFNPKQFNSEIKSAGNQLNQLQENIKSMPAAQKKTAEYKNLAKRVSGASTQLNNFNSLPQVRNIEKEASPEALRGVASQLPALSQAIAVPSAGAVSATQSGTPTVAAAATEIGKGMEAVKQALQEERSRLAGGGAAEASKLPSGVSLKRQPLHMPNIEPTQRAGAAGAPSGRSATMRGDTPITDQSVGSGGDEQRLSVIELPSRSTTEGQVFHAGAPMYGEEETEEEELGGGGLMVDEAMELQRAQAQARRMQTAAGVFVSGAAVGGGLERMSGEEEAYDVDLSELAGEEEEMAEEMEPGAQGAVDRAMQMAKDKVMEKAKQKAKDEAIKQLEKAGMKVAAKGTGAAARVGTEAAEVGTAPESIGITLLLLIVQLNVQLVLKYIFKSFGTVASAMGVGTPGQEVGEASGFSSESEKAESCIRGFAEQSFIEDVLTIFLDCLMCVNFLFMPPFCFCTIIIIILIAGIGAVGSVVGLDNIFGAITSLF